MLSSCIENFISEIEAQLPDLAETADLVRIGIFSPIAQAVSCRKRGQSPEFICFSTKRIVYPKKAILDWLRERASQSQGHSGNEPS